MAGVKKEVSFGLDNFKQAKVLSVKDSIAQLIINILMMKPGNYPSLPHIGVNLEKYLYSFEENIDVEGLKRDIFNQCSEAITFISVGDINVFVEEYENRGLLVIVIPITGLEDDSTLIIGASKDESLQTQLNYQFASIANE